MIHVIKAQASKEQMADMLQTLQTYIKLAVDVRRRVIAGGGVLHADCEAALLEDGSQQADVWGGLDSNESRSSVRIAHQHSTKAGQPENDD